MDKLKYVKLENPDGTYSDSIPLSVDSDYVDVNGNTLTSELNKKANTDEVAAIASGSPAGVYTTVSALITADPDHSKIYVVADSGKWYYYTNNTWTEGGIYQASVDLTTLDDLDEKMNTLMEYSSGTYLAENNLVFPLSLKRGDRLLIETTGNITVWTHSDKSVLDIYDVERLGYIPANTINAIFNITANAEYLRIYAVNNGSFKATVLDKKIEVIEKDIINNTNDIETNATHINEIIDNFIIRENLISELNIDKFYSCWNIGEVPTMETASGYGCGIADISEKEYISTNCNIDENFSCYADANHKKIAKITDYRVAGKTNVYSVPNNAYYAYWTNHGQDAIYLRTGLVLIGENKEIDNPPVDINKYPYNMKNYYGDSIKLENGFTIGQVLNDEKFNHIYYVEKDGSGDFDSLVDAIIAAVQYKNSVVYVGAGTWDIISEYGDEIETMNQNKRGLYLKNGIHVICSPKSKIVANYTGTNDTVREWFSVFNAGENGFTLENATIESSNIRYTIHDERDSADDFYINKYINCNMKHTNGFYAPCIGGGLGLNGYIIIKDCIFSGQVVDYPVYLVSYHNSADGAWDDSESKGAKSFIDIDGNYFNDTGSIRLLNMGKSTEMTKVIAHGNSLGSAIQHRNNDTLYYQVNIELKNYLNEIRT